MLIPDGVMCGGNPLADRCPAWSRLISGQISPGNTSSRGEPIMFGPGSRIAGIRFRGAPGLELSGDLRFRGPQGLRKLRVDCNGRPYVLARRFVGRKSDGNGHGRGR